MLSGDGYQVGQASGQMIPHLEDFLGGNQDNLSL